MSHNLAVFLAFFLFPLGVGFFTWLLFGDFPIGVFFATFALFGAILWKPNPFVDWLDSEIKKEKP